MQTQKFFLQLTDSDYNATSEKYNIDIEEQGIRNPAEITFESVTAKFSSDDDYLLINSNALASVAKHRPSALNGLYGTCVYVLHPEKRVVRAEETTVTTTTPLSDDSILDLADLFMFLNWDDATRITPPPLPQVTIF